MKIKKIIKISALALAGVTAGGIIFVKYDTPAAAEFTDNVLRPLLGANTVIAIEQVYYNTSDKLKQLTYNSKTAGVFQFFDQTLSQAGNHPGNTKLNLTPLRTNPNLTKENNEGVWNNRPLKTFPNNEVMAYTYIRPDAARPYAYVTVVQADMKALRLGAVAGTIQPGGPVGKPGPGKVPSEIVQKGDLVAAFDGGFQFRDGEYGMIVGDTTYLPLKENIGTLVGYKDGSLKIFPYQGQSLGNNVEFVRQNCPILIENSQIAVTNEKNKALWGRTPSYAIYTWRSGMGINKEGNILYAVGNNLTPETLAEALQTAGAVEAIQLDINPYWVRFNIFDSLGNGQYQTSTLIKNIQDGSKQYLGGYSKDFFYLFKKA